MMVDVTAGPTRHRPDTIVTLPRAYLLMSLLLLAQFVLGMAVNLFVTIPADHPGAHPANYFAGSARSIGWAIPHGGVWLAAHVGLGLALVLGGVVTITLATRSGNRVAIGTSVLGGAAILGAAFNGASFLDFNQDYSSMIMAALFAVAVGSDIWHRIPSALNHTVTGPRQSAWLRRRARGGHVSLTAGIRRGLRMTSAPPGLTSRLPHRPLRHEPRHVSPVDVARWFHRRTRPVVGPSGRGRWDAVASMATEQR